MFKLSTFTLALAASAYAMPTPNGGDGGDCDVGTLNCCNSEQSTGSLDLTQIISLLAAGLQLGELVGNLGLDCSPVTVGVGGDSW